ncbi:MAG: hypothetical protein JSW65_01590 [Candidatus Bipolaricaulota bacterium]|nr:MAG: hypothetical protein JSW65_01590 [Candidatus Bipolaricaulota bacterium]
MSVCGDMKVGQVYVCEHCGLELKVVKECDCESEHECSCSGMSCCSGELKLKS